MGTQLGYSLVRMTMRDAGTSGCIMQVRERGSGCKICTRGPARTPCALGVWARLSDAESNAQRLPVSCASDEYA